MSFGNLRDPFRSGRGLALPLTLLITLATGCPKTDAEAGRPSLEERRTHLIELMHREHGSQRALRIAELMGSATLEELAIDREVFASRSAVPQPSDLTLFALRWAELDPAAAFDWSVEMTTPLDWSARAAIMRIWAIDDPEAAARRAGSIRGTQQARAVCQSAVAQGWLLSGRPGLDAYLSGLDAGFQNETLGDVVEIVGTRRGPEALVEWAESLQVGARAKLTLFRKTALMLGRTSPPHAREWVARHSAEGQRSNVIKLAATGWATHDGPGMIDWLRTLPASEERDWGVEEGFKRWRREDQEQADAWIRNEEPAAWLDPAQLVYSGLISNDDALAGIDWTARIERDAIRDRALARIIRRWRIRDTQTALAWVDAQSDLSESLREQMLLPLKRPRRPPGSTPTGEQRPK